MVVTTIGIDKAGKVTEDLDLAVVVYETEFDDKGNVLSDIVYIKEGTVDMPPVITV